LGDFSRLSKIIQLSIEGRETCPFCGGPSKTVERYEWDWGTDIATLSPSQQCTLCGAEEGYCGVWNRLKTDGRYEFRKVTKKQAG
jgi:hypothetical protein